MMVAQEAVIDGLQSVIKEAAESQGNTLGDTANHRKPADSEKPLLQVAEAGVETIDVTTWVANNFGQCGLRNAAESGAVETEAVHCDPELASVIEAWLDLPESARAAIMKLIKSG